VSSDLLQLPVFHRSVPEQGSSDVAAAVCRPGSGDAGRQRGAQHAHQCRLQVQSSAS